MTASRWHQPVMTDAVLEHLAPRAGAVIVDGTVGTAGHSLLIAPRLLPNGTLIAIDRDADSLQQAQQRLVEFAPQVTWAHDDYRHLGAILQRVGVSQVDGILLDLGMSSAQVDAAERGFSFLREGPLDMRMDVRQAVTAATLVNTWPAEDLVHVLQTFGEERFARRIVRRLLEARRARPLTTTTQLAELVVGAYPPPARHRRVHPATRTFQALRMAVNDELGALAACLAQAHAWLRPGGRLVVIAFHSLEDRAVKRALAQGARDGQWTVRTPKPLTPSVGEIARNPRARSAKLRAAERCG